MTPIAMAGNTFDGTHDGRNGRRPRRNDESSGNTSYTRELIYRPATRHFRGEGEKGWLLVPSLFPTQKSRA